MRDTRLGEIVEARIAVRLCELRTLAAATALETARLVEDHGGWKGFRRNLCVGRWTAKAGYAALNRAAAIATRQPLAKPLWPSSTR